MATIYRRGRNWYLNWREEGKRFRLSLGPTTKRDAETTRQAKELELRTGQRILTNGKLLRDFAEDYLEWHKAEYPTSHFRIKGIYENHLTQFHNRPMDSLSVMEVEQWKSGRLQTASRATVRKELNTLNAIFNQAVAWGIISENPVRLVKKPKEISSKDPHWYTKEQLKKIYKAAGKRAPLWQFMANTGIRRQEAINLTWDDIRQDRVFVLSSEEARTKSGKYRSIPLSTGAQKALAKLKGQPTPFPQVFPQSLSRMFVTDAEAAGQGGSIHSLRHTFISILVQKGVALRIVQELAGHQSIKTTERYSHLAPSDPLDAVKKLKL